MTATEPIAINLDTIKAEIAARRDQEVSEEQAVAQAQYRYVRPFSTAADGLIEFVQNPEGRFMLGLHDVDAKTRGFGRGELVYVTGRAHSGKTQVVMNALANNPQAHVLMFTPDEVSELILSKLVAIRHGIDSEELERRIKARNPEVVDLVRRTAQHDFRNLVVIDDSLTMDQMTQAAREAEAYWGAPIDCVVIDFLELIPGGEGDAVGVASKSQALKRWTKHVNAPVICLHQASRSSGDRGKSAGMGAMRYGGETEAIFVLEVFRKREDESLDSWDRQQHENTVTVSVVKNKRPPCKTGETDLYIDPQTGLIRPLQPGDRTQISDQLGRALTREAPDA